jgi:hypothetical protein
MIPCGFGSQDRHDRTGSWESGRGRCVDRVVPRLGRRSCCGFGPSGGVAPPNDDLDGAGSCECGPGLGSPRHGSHRNHATHPAWPEAARNHRAPRTCTSEAPSGLPSPTTATGSCHRLLGENHHRLPRPHDDQRRGRRCWLSGRGRRLGAPAGRSGSRRVEGWAVAAQTSMARPRRPVGLSCSTVVLPAQVRS